MSPTTKQTSSGSGKTRRSTDTRVIRHSVSSRPVSLVPRNPSLRKGYQSTHLPGVNQRQDATIQFSVRSANQVSTGANTFAVLAKLQMNGAYDPDAAFSAGQPAAFAKYMQWYSKCVVRASKIHVYMNTQPVVQGDQSSTPIMWGITLLTNNTAPASLLEAVTGGPRVYTMQFANPDVKSLSTEVDIAKYLGVNDLENNPDYACTAISNPGQLVVAQLWLDNNTGATSLVQFHIEVVYDVTFYDPILIT